MKIIIVLIILFLIAGVLFGVYLESKDFNNGTYPNCNNNLCLFGTDSQGGRGYRCDECGYTTWVSYNYVDKYRRK